MTNKIPLTFSERLSDGIAQIVGCWTFIIIQLVILVGWMAVNTLPQFSWDPYPYILLNLALSFQAAFTAPIIMMSQNRQGLIDRKKSQDDYNVNVKAEKEIKKLHDKIDDLRNGEIAILIELLRKSSST